MRHLQQDMQKDIYLNNKKLLIRFLKVMIEKIVVPTLGESITEATVAKWLKNEGDSVKVDEAIVELETDKVNVEVPSPINGVLSEINSKDGAVVEVGALLGSISQTENSSVFPWPRPAASTPLSIRRRRNSAVSASPP